MHMVKFRCSQLNIVIVILHVVRCDAPLTVIYVLIAKKKFESIQTEISCGIKILISTIGAKGGGKHEISSQNASENVMRHNVEYIVPGVDQSVFQNRYLRFIEPCG